ncbi:MAG: hypothetical protein QM756_35720 [Polyangiaceae bacterium]
MPLARRLALLSLVFVAVRSVPARAQAPNPPETTPSSEAAPPSDSAAAPSAAPAPTVSATPPLVAPPPAPVATPAAPTTPAAPPPAAAPPPTQLKLELANGTSIRFGLLWQGQYEARGNSSNDDLTQNLYLRRFALLIGGTVLHDFEYFFDTDFADLFKAPTGDQSLKNGPGIATKDAFVTYKALGDQLKIDGGLLLPPGSHNSLQGGGSLYAWDFFLNTYRHNTVFGSTANPYGRDVGAQLRGLLFGGSLEYRAGVFQGKRNPPVTGAASRNPFRFAARVQLNLLDPETGYFYGGTYLGTKKIFSLGASVDYQHGGDESYRAFSGDAFVDLPVGPGGVTAQVNVIHRNGGSRVQLPKQTAFSAEAGYRFEALKLSPIARFERRFADAPLGNETDVGGGLAFWAFGHTSNLKAFYTRLIPDEPARAYDQFNLQWQVAFY